MASLGLAHKITTIQRASLIGSRQGRRGRGKRFLTSDTSFPSCSSSASLSEIASSSSSPPRMHTEGKDSDEDLLVILSCRLRPRYYHAASGQILSCRPRQCVNRSNTLSLMANSSVYYHAASGQGIIMPLPARYCHAVPSKILSCRPRQCVNRRDGAQSKRNTLSQRNHL